MDELIAIKKESTRSSRIYDIVCGMELTGLPELLKIEKEGEDFFFCGDGCKERFVREPNKFKGEPLLKLRAVEKKYRMGLVEVSALRGVDLHIWEGDFVSIIGASGSGKSTVLSLAGLLDRPTTGHIFFKGKDVALFSEDERAVFRSKTFGFVFQQYNLIPWLTAYENVALPLIFSHTNGKLAAGISQRFDSIGLKDRMTHRPFELSGGEQQRVAILRSLANDPVVILGDEPTGNLDSETGRNILNMLVDLNKVQKKTLVVVTHDPSIAEMADEVITLKDGHIERDHRIHKKIYIDA
ncbi:MAG: ATP-binding cassette domain-containing protein [Minisyncoccota bacterium]